VVSLALFTWSQDAYARQKPPKSDDVSAVAQYRESIPTASGPALPGARGDAAVRTRPLPAAVQAQVTRKAGPRAPLLGRVATSSDYGAPQDSLPRAAQAPAPAAGDLLGVLGAIPARLFDRGDARTLSLLVGLALATASLAFAGRRRPS
jgi:hypothetical protein